MAEISMAFQLREDDRFVVLVRAWSQDSSALPAFATETIYDHEDLFLKLVIYADLTDELTRKLVIAVILTVADPRRSGAWIAAEISADQNEVLGLNLPTDFHSHESLQPAKGFTAGTEAEAESPFGLETEGEQCDEFLLNAPTPFAMFAGPENIVTVVHPPSVRTLTRPTRG